LNAIPNLGIDYCPDREGKWRYRTIVEEIEKSVPQNLELLFQFGIAFLLGVLEHGFHEVDLFDQRISHSEVAISIMRRSAISMTRAIGAVGSSVSSSLSISTFAGSLGFRHLPRSNPQTDPITTATSAETPTMMMGQLMITSAMKIYGIAQREGPDLGQSSGFLPDSFRALLHCSRRRDQTYRVAS
jgi:hypothetical protein